MKFGLPLYEISILEISTIIFKLTIQTILFYFFLMCDQDIDFAFIEDVGQKVNELLMNDSNQTEWLNTAIEEFNMNGQYPPDLISEIIDYLTSISDGYCSQLVEDIQLIIQDEDIIENLLIYIYFPVTNEEEDIKSNCIDNSSFSGEIQKLW